MLHVYSHVCATCIHSTNWSTILSSRKELCTDYTGTHIWSIMLQTFQIFTGSSYIHVFLSLMESWCFFWRIKFLTKITFIQLEGFQTLNFIIMMAFRNFGVKIIATVCRHDFHKPLHNCCHRGVNKSTELGLLCLHSLLQSAILSTSLQAAVPY